MTDTDGGAAAVRDVPLLTVLRSSPLSQYPCFAALFPLKGDAPFSSLPQRLEKLYGEICGEEEDKPMPGATSLFFSGPGLAGLIIIL